MFNKDKIKHHNFILFHHINTISKDGRIIKLTETETKILTLLLQYPTIVFSKDDILAYAWNEEDNNYTSVVPQAISLLRKKLYRHNIDAIDTIKGRGYKASRINKSKNRKINLKKILPISCGFIVILSYSLLHNKNIQPKINQKLIESSENIYQPSDSELIVLDKTLLKNNIKYFINKQKQSLSISACKISNDECSSIYNKIYFIKDEKSSFNMDKIIDDISFKFEKPLNSLTSKENSKFKISSSINISAVDNVNYKGHAYINYDVTKVSDDLYNATLSAYVKETGYIGSYSYNANIVVTTKKQKDQYIALVEKDKNDAGSGRLHFGTIKDQNQLYVYPDLLNNKVKKCYMHIYPISKGVNYIYIEDIALSYLAFSYK